MNPTVELIGAPTIRMEMDMKTAQALVALLRRVGGYPNTTRRGSMEALLRALTEAGITTDRSNDLDGHLVFQVTHYVQN